MERFSLDIVPDPDWRHDEPSVRRPWSAPAAMPDARLVRSAGLALGSRVRTMAGPVAVEDLEPGDLIITRDAAAQPLIWKSPPIRSPIVRLGPGIGGLASGRDNARPSVLSGTQGLRLLLADEAAELLFGAGEVLARTMDLAAHHPIAREGEAVGPCIALLLETHALIEVDGVWCETFLPDAPRLAELGHEAERALKRDYPRIGHAAGQAGYQTARLVLNRREVGLLA